MTGSRDRRARHLRRRLPDRRRQAGLDRRRRATTTGIPTCTSATRPEPVDLAPATTAGVLYDGMTRRRLAGPLHDRRQTDRRRHRQQRRPLRGRVGAGGAVTLRGLDRLGAPATPTPATRSPARRTHTGTRSAAPRRQLRRRRVRRRRRRRGRRRHHLLPLARRSSTAPTEPNAAEPLRRRGRARRRSSSPRSSPDNPAVLDAVDRHERHRYGDFQVTPTATSRSSPPTLSLTGYPNLGHSRDLSATTPTATARLRLLRADRSRRDRRRDASPYGLNLTDDGRVFFTTAEPARPARHRTATQDAYEWKNGAAQLISTGREPDRLRPALGQRRRRRRLLLHPRDARPGRTTTATR